MDTRSANSSRVRDTEKNRSAGGDDRPGRSTLDLRGETCPDTFVKSKLMIESLQEGAELEVLVDDRRSAERVPVNMENHGQEHLKTLEVSGVWRLIFRKQKQSEPERWVVMD